MKGRVDGGNSALISVVPQGFVLSIQSNASSTASSNSFLSSAEILVVSLFSSSVRLLGAGLFLRERGLSSRDLGLGSEQCSFEVGVVQF